MRAHRLEWHITCPARGGGERSVILEHSFIFEVAVIGRQSRGGDVPMTAGGRRAGTQASEDPASFEPPAANHSTLSLSLSLRPRPRDPFPEGARIVSAIPTPPRHLYLAIRSSSPANKRQR